MAKWKTLAVCLVLCFSILLLSGCERRPSGSEPASETAEIGQPAPNFKLPDLAGQQVSLDQFKGKVVLLDLWATWCGPCRMTMPVVENLQKEFSGTMVLLAVNLQDSRDDVRDYIRAQGIHSRVLLDQEGAVGAMYGAESIPREILIDKQGIIRFVMPGYAPGMASQLRAQISKLL
ncbi:MAG TPA: TlpA disulfide reductase family protein [Acidobacteriota bacterium]|nr:TlpA disulfide reductase family protein [Acidobacteriota bacterium]